MKIRISPELKYELRNFYRRWGRSLIHVTGALLLAFTSIVFLNSKVGHRVELAVLQQFYSFRGVRPSPLNVVIVKIDDKSYQKLEASTNFPLPRKYIAEALEKIVAASPKVIILDAKIPNERFIDADSDARIAAALQAGQTTIWTGEIPHDAAEPGTDVVLTSDDQFKKSAKMELPMTIYGDGDVITYIAKPSLRQTELYQLVPIARALVELGHVSVGTPQAHDLINYYGPKNSVPSISLSDLIGDNGSSVESQLRGKIVLMGYHSLQYAKGTLGKDEFKVPISDKGMFGVEIHATIIENLIDGTWLKRITFANENVIVLLVVFFIASYALRAPTPSTLGIIFGFIALATVFSYVAFAYYNRWTSGVGTLWIAGIATVLISVIYFFKRTEMYKDYINRTFGFEKEREL